MKYSTVYVGMDVHKESFSLCCYTQMRRNKPNTLRKLMVITAKSSTTSRPGVSITGTMPCSYAVMRLAASDSRYTAS